MKELVDEYSQLAFEAKKIAARQKDIKAALLASWEARPLEDEERNTLRGVTNVLTVVVATSNTFDRAKYEKRFGAFHAAYFKSRESVSLRSA